MSKSAREIVFEGMELIPQGLIPFVEKRLSSVFSNQWQNNVVDRIRGLNFKNEIQTLEFQIKISRKVNKLHRRCQQSSFI